MPRPAGSTNREGHNAGGSRPGAGRKRKVEASTTIDQATDDSVQVVPAKKQHKASQGELHIIE